MKPKYIVIGLSAVIGVVILVIIGILAGLLIKPDLIASDQISGPQLEAGNGSEADVETLTRAFVASQKAARLIAEASERDDLVFSGAGKEDKFAGLSLRLRSTNQRVELGYSPDHLNFELVKSWSTSPPCEEGQVFPFKLKFVQKRQSRDADGWPGAASNWLVIEE